MLADVPRGGVYLEVILRRPPIGAKALMKPHFVRPRLDRLAVALFPKGPPGLGFQRVQGRLRSQYDVDLQVIYERRVPTKRTIARAQRAVDALHFPRWVPPRLSASPRCR